MIERPCLDGIPGMVFKGSVRPDALIDRAVKARRKLEYCILKLVDVYRCCDVLRLIGFGRLPRTGSANERNVVDRSSECG